MWVIVSELAFQLFALVALGFVLRRFGVIDDNFQKQMGNLLILVVLPAAILSSANTPFSEEMGMSLIWAFLFILFFYVAGIILLRIATRAVRYPEQNRHLLINLLMFANTGFLGFPVVQYIYGGQGVLYAVIFNLLFNFFLFTYGVMMLGGREITWKKFLLSPLTISMVVTIILFVTRLEMPNFIVGVLDKLGGLSAPLSMFIVGGSLSVIPLKKLLTNRHAYWVTGVGQLLLPALMMLLLWATGQRGVMPSTIVLLAGLPPATLNIVTAEQHGADVAFATEAVVLGSLLMVVTIPLTALISSVVFGP